MKDEDTDEHSLSKILKENHGSSSNGVISFNGKVKNSNNTSKSESSSTENDSQSTSSNNNSNSSSTNNSSSKSSPAFFDSIMHHSNSNSSSDSKSNISSATTSNSTSQSDTHNEDNSDNSTTSEDNNDSSNDENNAISDDSNNDSKDNGEQGLSDALKNQQMNNMFNNAVATHRTKQQLENGDNISSNSNESKSNSNINSVSTSTSAKSSTASNTTSSNSSSRSESNNNNDSDTDNKDKKNNDNDSSKNKNKDKNKNENKNDDDEKSPKLDNSKVVDKDYGKTRSYVGVDGKYHNVKPLKNVEIRQVTNTNYYLQIVYALHKKTMRTLKNKINNHESLSRQEMFQILCNNNEAFINMCHSLVETRKKYDDEIGNIQDELQGTKDLATEGQAQLKRWDDEGVFANMSQYLAELAKVVNDPRFVSFEKQLKPGKIKEPKTISVEAKKDRDKQHSDANKQQKQSNQKNKGKSNNTNSK